MTITSLLASLLGVVFVLAAFVFGYLILATRRIAADAERRVPPAGKFVDVLGNRLHYIEAGQGRPIILVHGLGGQLWQFRQTLFDDLARDFRVIALDRPGSGYSTRAAGDSGRLPEQANIIGAFMDALGLEGPLIVGHSLGGAISLALAIGHPGKVVGLALLAPLTHLSSEEASAVKGLYIPSPLLRRVMAHTLAVPMSLKYAKAALDFFFGPQTAPADYLVAGGGLLGLRPSHFYATSTDMVAIDKDIGAMDTRFGEISIPVGVLFGTADRVLDHREQTLRLQARIEGLEVEFVDGLGHMVQYGATAQTASFIRRMAEKSFAAAPVAG